MQIHEMEKLAEIINREFGYPFLKRDFVRAYTYKNSFCLHIGNRDLQFDDKMNIIGVGTHLDDAEEETSNEPSIQ